LFDKKGKKTTDRPDIKLAEDPMLITGYPANLQFAYVLSEMTDFN